MKPSRRPIRLIACTVMAAASFGCQTKISEAGEQAEASGPKGGIEKRAGGEKEKEKGKPAKERTVNFIRDIKPILEDRCVMCHNRATLKKRVSFENRELALKGDAAGRVIVPGDAEGSRILAAIKSPDFGEKAMPPVSHRITKEEIALFEVWIDEGVEWPDGPEGQLKSDKIPAE